MKVTYTLLLLVTLVLAKKKKIKVLLDTPQPKQSVPEKPVPEDIKQSQDFLSQSEKEFDQVKKISAAQAVQNSIINQSLDLTIPKLEADLSSSQLVAARKLEDDEEKEEEGEEGGEDKLDDVEKRLFSIEDKIDHLLLHAGHEVSPHNSIMTPWGMHFAPSHQDPNSLHKKLTTVDYLFGNHPGMGMGGMGMGMGMGMGGMGMGNHMMAIGHMNPMGYGLDHHASAKWGMYPYHALHPLHPMHSWSPYGMGYGLHHGLGYGMGMHPAAYGMGAFHPMYGHLGLGMMSHSKYRDDMEEERHQRFMRHQRDMDEITSKPLLPPSLPKPESSSSSLFLI